MLCVNKLYSFDGFKFNDALETKHDRLYGRVILTFSRCTVNVSSFLSAFSYSVLLIGTELE